MIISPPDDSYGPLGANLTLDCEARGFPAPVISWKFVSAKGETISLPSKLIKFLYLVTSKKLLEVCKLAATLF